MTNFLRGVRHTSIEFLNGLSHNSEEFYGLVLLHI